MTERSFEKSGGKNWRKIRGRSVANTETEGIHEEPMISIIRFAEAPEPLRVGILPQQFLILLSQILIFTLHCMTAVCTHHTCIKLARGTINVGILLHQ